MKNSNQTKVSSQHFIVALDGVSGSGKSSTAKKVAKELGILHLDTGAMYRAVTFLAMEQGVEPTDTEALQKLTEDIHWVVDSHGKLSVGGRDLSHDIRQPVISASVSEYAKIPEVRKILVEVQRKIGQGQSYVVEGRDMATVVFPEARFKFYMSASPEVRAQRRVMELISMGLSANYGQVLHNLVERDHKDSGREHSPLQKAPDAIEIDTSGLTFEGQVAIIVGHVLKNLP